jgi:hypothetical protein
MNYSSISWDFSEMTRINNFNLGTPRKILDIKSVNTGDLMR